VSFQTLYNDAQNIAQEKVQNIAAGSGKFRTGPMSARKGLDDLSRIVAENAVDLIVVGTHGRKGLGKLVLDPWLRIFFARALSVLTVGPAVYGRANLPGFYGNGRESGGSNSTCIASSMPEPYGRIAEGCASSACPGGGISG